MGIGPAGYIPETTQDWLANLIVLAVVGVITFVSIRRKKHKLQFGVRSLLLLTMVSAIVIQSITYFQLGVPAAVHAKPNRLLKSFQTISGSDPASWLPGPEWIRRSILQWLIQDGPAIGLGLAALVVVLGGFALRQTHQAAINVFLLFYFAMMLSVSVWAWAFPASWAVTKKRNDQINQYLFEPDFYYQDLEQGIQRRINDPTFRKAAIEFGRTDLEEYQVAESAG